MESALKDMNRLKAKGLDAYFKEVEIPEKGTWYRVYVVAPQPKSRSGTSLKDKKKPVGEHKTGSEFSQSQGQGDHPPSPAAGPGKTGTICAESQG